MLTYNLEFENITESGTGPVTFVSVEVCRDDVATDVVVGTDTLALDDVSRGVEDGTVRTEDERVSTLKMYVIYVNLFI